MRVSHDTFYMLGLGKAAPGYMFVQCIQNAGELYKIFDQCHALSLASAFSSLAAGLTIYKIREVGRVIQSLHVCMRDLEPTEQ